MTKTIEIPLKLWRAEISLEAKRYYIDLLAYNSDKVIGEKASETAKEELEREGFLPLPKKVTLEEVKEVLAHFNQSKGLSNAQGYKPTESRKKTISTRIKEYGLQACKDVVTYMGKKWLPDENMKNNFTPDTIFRPSNFDKYKVEMEARKTESKERKMVY